MALRRRRPSSTAADGSGQVHISCERPLAGATTVAHGHLEVSGWVSTPAPLESVTIEMDGDEIRVKELASAPAQHASGVVQRFHGRIKTQHRAPGPRAIQVAARDAAGNRASCSREVDLQPFEKLSTETLELALAEGRTVMSIDMPGRGAVLLADYISIRGWAHCPRGVREVVLFVDGRRRCAVPHGLPRPDLSARWDIEGLDSSGLLLGLDLSSWSPGRHTLAAIAYGNDGRAVGRSTHFRLGADEQARRALRRSDGVPGIRARASGLPAPRAESMTVCPLNADPGLERSLAAQTVDGCTVDRPGDLSSCLRAIAQRRDGHQLLVGAGVMLEPHAVEELLTALATRPQAEVVYTDEESPPRVGADPEPFLKPSWSPELLASTDYVGPLVAVSAHAARAALDAHPAPVESIYELLLRLVDTGTTVEHLPAAVFSYERAERADRDPARLAIERLASIQGRRAQVTELSQPGCRHVGWEIRDQARVSIVLLTGGKPIAMDCVRSIREHTTYENVEVVIVDASGHGAAQRLVPLVADMPHRVVTYRGRFHFCTASNLGAQAATGEHLLFLNDDIEVRSPDWIERMLEHSQTPGVGVVGAKLLYPDTTIQHCGVMLGGGAIGPRHPFRGMREDAGGYRDLLRVARNSSAVTAACMMVPATLFWELGGFDEALVVEFNDTDLCLRALEHGSRVVWTPRAVLTHYEQLTRGGALCLPDHATFAARWGGRFPRGDPFYHPALSETRDYVLAVPSEKLAEPASARSKLDL